MAKEKRRSWLDKISSWILGALPDDKASAPQTPKQQEVTPLPSTQQPPTTPRLGAEPPRPFRPDEQEIGETLAQQAARSQTQPSEKRQSVAAGAPSTAADPPGNTINQAWRAFERAWADAGLSDHYFLEGEELEQTLAVLDRSFEDELIEWLFQLCTKPEALRDLAGIIERGQVKPNDDIAAIRAFAYVSVAIRSRPGRSASSTEPISTAEPQSHPAPYQPVEASSFAKPEVLNSPSSSGPL
jgi:hypothetical protein